MRIPRAAVRRDAGSSVRDPGTGILLEGVLPGLRAGEIMSRKRSGGCIGLGSVCAVIVSAALNHSFWWGLFHFFCGWFYILYAAFFRTKEIVPALRAMFL